MKDIVEPTQVSQGDRAGLFRLMADSAPVLLWVSSDATLRTFLSQAWLDFTGRSLESELGEGWTHGVHPDDLDRCVAGLRTAFDHREPFELEYRLRRHDGAYRWILDRGSPYQDPDGAFAGYMGASIDITERRVAAEQLQVSEERYRRILATCLEGVWIVDAEGHTTYVNAAMTKMLGHTEAEMLGARMTDFVDPSDVAAVSEELANASGGASAQRDFCFRASDGSRVWTIISSSPVLDANGQYAGALAMVTDITQRKEAEGELHRLNQELERHVAERTAELAAANQELEAFCYSVSHDLRGPLRAIDGFSQAILEDHGKLLSEQGLSDLHRVRAAARRMGDLIDALLTLSRLSRLEMKREQVNLSELAEAFVGELRLTYRERTMKVSIEPDLIVEGDARLLRVVVENLLSNAWKFTRENPECAVSFERCEMDGKPGFRVRDNGVGFDQQYVHKLFTPFERLHDSRLFPGTGVGLATVQRILSRHGGAIRAESEVGKGATFTFRVEPSATPA
jgi:PAS domain S-box-containing protein